MVKLIISPSPHPIPDENVISDIYGAPVLSSDGKPIQFGDLVTAEDHIVNVVVIFIRHFFCTCDQDYVRSLMLHLAPTVLATAPAGSPKLIIVGCGDPSLIPAYATETSCEFPIYTDPTGYIHEKLQMKRSLIVSKTPSYAKQSVLGLVIRSIKQMVFSGYDALKGGKFQQNGGEMIFREGKCVWMHRMESMGDHLPAEELVKAVLGDKDLHTT